MAIALQLLRVSDVKPDLVIGVSPALEPFGGLLNFVFKPMAQLAASLGFIAQMVNQRAVEKSYVARMLDKTGSQVSLNMVSHYQHLLRQKKHVKATLRMMADWDLGDLRRSLKSNLTDCVLLAGDHDLAVPPGQVARVAEQFPGFTLRPLKGLGHLAQEEAGAQVLEEITKIMDERAIGEGHD